MGCDQRGRVVQGRLLQGRRNQCRLLGLSDPEQHGPEQRQVPMATRTPATTPTTTDSMATSIGSPYYRTNVGEFENSASAYGTFDQGGNVWEWNEAIT